MTRHKFHMGYHTKPTQGIHCNLPPCSLHHTKVNNSSSDLRSTSKRHPSQSSAENSYCSKESITASGFEERFLRPVLGLVFPFDVLGLSSFIKD